MPSLSIEALVEERVAQLEVISQRRNELLREMYHLMRRRRNAGAVSIFVDEDGVSLQDWLDKHDLTNNPNSGMISNIPHNELCATSLSPNHHEFKSIANELPDVSDADSPMSDPPASPRSEFSVSLQVPESDDPLATSKSEESPPRATPMSRKRPRVEDEPDELNLVGISRSPSLPSVGCRSQSQTHRASLSKSRTFSPWSPGPVNATLDQFVEVVVAEGKSLMRVEDHLHENIATPIDEVRQPTPDLVLPSSSPVNERRKVLPRAVVHTTTVDIASIQPSLLIPTPTSPAADPAFSFDEAESEPPVETPPDAPTPVEAHRHHHFNPPYSLPPIKSLPPEYLRKGKSAKQKKRDKERDKAEGKNKDEWTPMGLTKWGATIRANPVWKRVSRATKCLSTRDWGVAIAELRLTRALERAESLENVAKWSYRQPKRQKNLGGLTKTHWDYLMDEMKWMRVDFREERRWKYVVAFNLSSAVLEWHEAGSHEERLRLGICVLWKRPRSSQDTPPEDVDMVLRPTEHNGYTPMADESDGDEEEGEAEQRDFVDALETRNALEEALDGTGSNESADLSQHHTPCPDHVQPKVEDIEDSFALQDSDNAMNVDTQQDSETKVENDEKTGLKTHSTNPNLGSQQNTQFDAAPAASSSKTSKTSLYAPLREQIAYTDERKLFLNDDDLNLANALSDLTTDDTDVEPLLSAHDLSDIFPDLQALVMPDVASSSGEGKKKDKKSGDDNRRVEDSGFTKMAPLGRFMHYKPTLLGPLQPARRWEKGEWKFFEETAVTVDFDSAIGKTVDDTASDLFDGSRPSASLSTLGLPLKDGKKRSEHIWTADEDSLLKIMVDRYANNWLLVSDSFNSSRVTISTDKRTPWECFERWSSGHRSHPDVNSPANVECTPPPASTSAQGQMTTRGVKRLASITVTQNQNQSTGASQTSDTKKRRRHTFMYETMRKAARKREAAQKTSMNQRKASNIHDTHGQYQKMPKLTPAELSRMKYEKESREQQEILIARRRHEEAARQAMMQRDPRLQVAAAGQPQQAVVVASAAAAAAQQQQPNGTPRSAAQPAQAVPQIRTQTVPQVNISQQQRIPTPMAPATVAGARISPQQLLQAQAAQAQARAIAAAAHAQAQAQSQVPVQGSPVTSMNGLPAGAHLSPPYQSRAATSSPGVAPQGSPTHSVGTPSNAASPRPSSAQPQLPMQPAQMPVNAVPRQAHYFPVVPTLPGGHFTQEQMDQALRLSNLIQHRTNMAQQAQQAQQNSQYPSQN